MVHNRLKKIKQSGLQLDINTIIEDAFEIYKKIVVQGAIAYIMLIVLLLAILGGLMAIYLDKDSLQVLSELENTNILPLPLFIYITGITLVLNFFLYPMIAGFYKMCQNADTNNNPSISDIFYYYQAPYFIKLALTSVILGIISAIISMFFVYYINYPNLGTLVSIIVSFILSLTVPFIIFGNLSVPEALKASALVVSKAPATIFFSFLIGIIGSFVGIIGLFIGIFFTMPFINAMAYSIYKNAVGFSDNNLETQP